MGQIQNEAQDRQVVMSGSLTDELLSLVVASLVILGVLFTGDGANAGSQETISGRVVGVVDGDTIDILTPEKENIRVRLSGIDAPEKNQPYGQASKHYLSRLAYSCTAKVEVIDTDRYGRTIGQVHACGSDLNEAMIHAGYAWVYRKYVEPKHEAQWLKVEANARASRKGLWGGVETPVEPWVWRKGGRE